MLKAGSAVKLRLGEFLHVRQRISTYAIFSARYYTYVVVQNKIGLICYVWPNYRSQ